MWVIVMGNSNHSGGHKVTRRTSRGHFPILSRDPSFQKTSRTPGKTAGFEKNDG